MGPIIWRWCRTVLDTEELPSINILSYILPLLKQGKDPGDPASYRPVALMEVLVRILEKVHNRSCRDMLKNLTLFPKHSMDSVSIDPQ